MSRASIDNLNENNKTNQKDDPKDDPNHDNAINRMQSEVLLDDTLLGFEAK